MTSNPQNLLGVTGLTGAIFQEDSNTGDVLLDDLGQPEPYYIKRGEITNGFYFVEYSIDRINKSVFAKLTPFKNKQTFIKSCGKERLANCNPIIFQFSDRAALVQEDGTITEPAITIFDSYFSYTEVRKKDKSELDQVLKFITTVFNGTHPLQSFHINFTTMTIDDITQANINNAIA